MESPEDVPIPTEAPVEAAGSALDEDAAVEAATVAVGGQDEEEGLEGLEEDEGLDEAWIEEAEGNGECGDERGDGDDVEDADVADGDDLPPADVADGDGLPPAVVDIRSFLPVEIDQINESLSLSQAQVLLLTRELSEAREALQREVRGSDTLRRQLEALAIDAEARLRRQAESLHAASAVEQERQKAGLMADVARLQEEILRLETLNGRLQEAQVSQTQANDDLTVSLRLAENRARRLEFALRDQNDADTELRVMLQSCMYTMNKRHHADQKKVGPVSAGAGGAGGAGMNGKVRRLVDKVKASDGIDVTSLSVEDVQGFVALVVRRLEQSAC